MLSQPHRTVYKSTSVLEPPLYTDRTASGIPRVFSIERFHCISKYCETKWMTINARDSSNVLSGKMSHLKCCRCYISTISLGITRPARKTYGVGRWSVFAGTTD